MATHTKIILALLFPGVLMAAACNKALVVKNVNYAQQLETVLIPDKQGTVDDVRHGISYSILPFQYNEFQDTSSVQVSEVRMIRNTEGYYFITANGFRHVYVMEPERGALKLKKKILINEEGIHSPAFNWREPAVQLIDQSTKTIFLLTEKGMAKEKEETAS